MTTPEYPDLSRWPEGIDTTDHELSDEARARREKIASLNPHEDMFCLNPHVIWDRGADGSVTLSVPWSSFRYTVPPDTPGDQEVVAFSNAYDEVLKSPDELDRFKQVMRDHGVIPLSERD